MNVWHSSTMFHANGAQIPDEFTPGLRVSDVRFAHGPTGDDGVTLLFVGTAQDVESLLNLDDQRDGAKNVGPDTG